MARQHNWVEHNGETVIKCGRPNPENHEDFPFVPPGTRILREDGNVYTLSGNGVILIDDEGYLVHPVRLTRYRRQEEMKAIVRIADARRRHGV